MRRITLFTGLGLILTLCCNAQTYIPFSYQVPPLPTVNAGNDFTVTCGVAFTLNGSTLEGTAPFTISWSPAAYLNNPNVLSPIANIPSPVDFVLRVTDANACVAIDTVKVHCSPVGIDENSLDQTVLYPNPGQGTVVIAGIPISVGKLRITCHTLQGKVVSTSEMKAAGSNVELDLHYLPPGVYNVCIQSDVSIVNHKLLIL